MIAIRMVDATKERVVLYPFSYHEFCAYEVLGLGVALLELQLDQNHHSLGDLTHFD